MEYQYYEFLAVDRPLNKQDMEALRSLSTRARITSTSFTNHYDWGDFKGDPMQLMERWFDLHLYFANWGSRRLMIRLPRRLVNESRLRSFLSGPDIVRTKVSGENLIIDIYVDDKPADWDDDDGSSWLSALEPLRADLLSGDWRMFYLLWLLKVEIGSPEDDEKEPLTGIGPLTGGLEAFADFFRMDRDLVQAAAEGSAYTDDTDLPAGVSSQSVIASIPEAEKLALLERLATGDPYVAAEVQNRVREALVLASSGIQKHLRTVSDLRTRAQEIRKAREVAEAKRLEALRQQEAREAEKARRIHLNILKRRGGNSLGRNRTGDRKTQSKRV